jgi:ferredoxin
MNSIFVDPEKCFGHARCIQYVPEVFAYNDTTNQAFVREGADLEGHAQAVTRAVVGCPEGAIRTLAPEGTERA